MRIYSKFIINSAKTVLSYRNIVTKLFNRILYVYIQACIWLAFVADLQDVKSYITYIVTCNTYLRVFWYLTLLCQLTNV